MPAGGRQGHPPRLAAVQVEDADLAGLAAIGMSHAAVRDEPPGRRAIHGVRQLEVVRPDVAQPRCSREQPDAEDLSSQVEGPGVTDGSGSPPFGGGGHLSIEIGRAHV